VANRVVPDFGTISCVAISASEARRNLFPLIEQVNNDRVPVEIVSKAGSAFLVAADEYRALEETAYLLRAPANARRLLAALDEAQRGKARTHDLDRD
jgi:antitoxin YefM